MDPNIPPTTTSVATEPTQAAGPIPVPPGISNPQGNMNPYTQGQAFSPYGYAPQGQYMMMRPGFMAVPSQGPPMQQSMMQNPQSFYVPPGYMMVPTTPQAQSTENPMISTPPAAQYTAPQSAEPAAAMPMVPPMAFPPGGGPTPVTQLTTPIQTQVTQAAATMLPPVTQPTTIAQPQVTAIFPAPGARVTEHPPCASQAQTSTTPSGAGPAATTAAAQPTMTKLAQMILAAQSRPGVIVAPVPQPHEIMEADDEEEQDVEMEIIPEPTLQDTAAAIEHAGLPLPIEPWSRPPIPPPQLTRAGKFKPHCPGCLAYTTDDKGMIRHRTLCQLYNIHLCPFPGCAVWKTRRVDIRSHFKWDHKETRFYLPPAYNPLVVQSSRLVRLNLDSTGENLLPPYVTTVQGPAPNDPALGRQQLFALPPQRPCGSFLYNRLISQSLSYQASQLNTWTTPPPHLISRTEQTPERIGTTDAPSKKSKGKGKSSGTTPKGKGKSTGPSPSTSTGSVQGDPSLSRAGEPTKRESPYRELTPQERKRPRPAPSTDEPRSLPEQVMIPVLPGQSYETSIQAALYLHDQIRFRQCVDQAARSAYHSIQNQYGFNRWEESVRQELRRYLKTLEDRPSQPTSTSRSSSVSESSDTHFTFGARDYREHRGTSRDSSRDTSRDTSASRHRPRPQSTQSRGYPKAKDVPKYEGYVAASDYSEAHVRAWLNYQGQKHLPERERQQLGPALQTSARQKIIQAYWDFVTYCGEHNIDFARGDPHDPFKFRAMQPMPEEWLTKGTLPGYTVEMPRPRTGGSDRPSRSYHRAHPPQPPISQSRQCRGESTSSASSAAQSAAVSSLGSGHAPSPAGPQRPQPTLSAAQERERRDRDHYPHQTLQGPSQAESKESWSFTSGAIPVRPFIMPTLSYDRYGRLVLPIGTVLTMLLESPIRLRDGRFTPQQILATISSPSVVTCRLDGYPLNIDHQTDMESLRRDMHRWLTRLEVPPSLLPQELNPDGAQMEIDRLRWENLYQTNPEMCIAAMARYNRDLLDRRDEQLRLDPTTAMGASAPKRTSVAPTTTVAAQAATTTVTQATATIAPPAADQQPAQSSTVGIVQPTGQVQQMDQESSEEGEVRSDSEASMATDDTILYSVPSAGSSSPVPPPPPPITPMMVSSALAQATVSGVRAPDPLPQPDQAAQTVQGADQQPLLPAQSVTQQDAQALEPARGDADQAQDDEDQDTAE